MTIRPGSGPAPAPGAFGDHPIDGIDAVAIANTVREPLLVLDERLHVRFANGAFYGQFGVRPETTVGHSLWAVGDGQWNHPALRLLLEDVLPTHTRFADFELTHHCGALGSRVLRLNASEILVANSPHRYVLLAMEDVTQRRRTERELEGAWAFFRAGFDALQEHVAILDADGTIVDVNAAWTRFARANGCTDAAVWRGANYFAVCEAAVGDRSDGAAAAARGIREVLAGELPAFRLEYPCDGPDDKRWFVLRAVRFEAAGRPLAYVAHIDVTERHLAEQALRASEARYRRLVETSHEGICTVDETGCITYANRRLSELLGYSSLELAGRPIFDFMDTEAAFNARTRFARRQRGISEVEELPLRHRDGTAIWMREAASPLWEDDGTFRGAVFLLGDVTERRAAQQRLAASERLFRALTENSSEVVTILAADGTIRYSNPTFQRAFGVTADEAIGSNVARFLHPDDLASVMETLARLAREPGGVTTLEYRVPQPDGSWRYRRAVAESLIHDEAVAGIVINSQDVTEQRRAEETLRDNERRYRMLFQRNPLPMYVADAATRHFLAVNDAALEHYGYSREEFLAMRLDDIRPAEDRDAFILAFEAAGGCAGSGTHRHLKKDGTAIVADIVADTVDFGDRAARLILANDVTQRVRAAAERERLVRQIEDERARLDALVRQLPFAVIIAEAPSGRLVKANDHVDRVFGHPFRPSSTVADYAEWVGYHPDGRLVAPHEWPIARAVAAGAEVCGEVYRYPHPGEPDAWIRLSAAPIRDAAGRIVAGVVVAEDITAQRATEAALRDSEERLRQAQKMEAIGRLAGGVAHDFNNLLTVITGYTAILLSELPPQDPVVADLREVEAAAQRAAALTRQLLAFSRQQVLQPRVIDPHQVIGGMESMLRRLIGEDVEFSIGGDGEAARAVADPGQIEQVVMNLVVNARDAMPTGGQLSIDIGAAALTTADRERHPYVVPGEYVRIRVRDTGCGMDELTKARIFDPFFTTKDAGQGTGLGLATVYGIVKQSGGYIWVDSAPGAGATFLIHLPRVTGDTADGDGEAASPGVPARRGATVLVVEDEDAMRRLMERALRERGYTVLVAAGGDEALALAERHDGPIHVLVTDIVMPRMSGQELASRLADQHGGELPVLFVSGYSVEAVSSHGVLRSGASLLQKPFRPAELVIAVSELLRGHPELLQRGEHRVPATPASGARA